MLSQLLNTPKHPQKQHYEYLPVSTSLPEQLKKEAMELFQNPHSKLKNKHKSQQFISNDDPENVKEDLIMLKLKGYVDRADFKSKNVQMKKLPSKVQVGRMIEGDPFMAVKNRKIRNKKREMELAEYYMDLDKKESFSSRKFSQIQRLKQRRKKIKKRTMMKKNRKK